MTEKERIDYEIKAKAAQRDKELAEWVGSFFLAVFFFFVVFILLTFFTS